MPCHGGKILVDSEVLVYVGGFSLQVEMEENGLLMISYGSKNPVPLRRAPCFVCKGKRSERQPSLLRQPHQTESSQSGFLPKDRSSSSLSEMEKRTCPFVHLLIHHIVKLKSRNLCPQAPGTVTLAGQEGHTPALVEGARPAVHPPWAAQDDWITFNPIAEPSYRHVFGEENHLFNSRGVRAHLRDDKAGRARVPRWP